MRKVADQDIAALYAAIMTLENRAEARKFFRDLLTQTEIDELAKRWKSARMLAAGIPYAKIVAKTGLSSTTVARVSRWVKTGTGGYRLALRRMGICQ